MARDYRERFRELGRATGTLLTPGEYAELAGEPTVELAAVTYRFSPGGRCEPPVDMTVRCLPRDLDGVYRSVAKLLESRGWASEARVSRLVVPRVEVEGFLSRKGES